MSLQCFQRNAAHAAAMRSHASRRSASEAAYEIRKYGASPKQLPGTTATSSTLATPFRRDSADAQYLGDLDGGDALRALERAHRAGQSAAVTTISTRSFGSASRTSPQQRVGVWPGSTQASHTAFMPS